MIEPGRISCCVPFCRHTRGLRKGETALPNEWVCGKHWSMVPKKHRARLSRALRWYRRRFGDNGYWTYPPGSKQRISAIRYAKHWSKCWELCKRAAIETAGGL